MEMPRSSEPFKDRFPLPSFELRMTLGPIALHYFDEGQQAIREAGDAFRGLDTARVDRTLAHNSPEGTAAHYEWKQSIRGEDN